MKYAFVGLFQIILLEYLRQVVDKLVLLLYVELFLDVVGLLNVVADLQEEVVSYVMFLGQTSEDFVFFALLEVLSPNVTDERPNTIDVVSKRHTAECLNEDEAKSLEIVGCNDISESNCEHDVDCPVVRPDVYLVPRGSINILCYHPVL